MRDITNYMSDLCDQCCHDDPTNRPSSVQLLEYVRQRMRRDNNYSSFVVEALRKDIDSTFWDYLLIERVLQAGADPNTVGTGAITAIRLIANASNKSANDAVSVYKLLLRYGAAPDDQVSLTSHDQVSNLGLLRHTPSSSFDRRQTPISSLAERETASQISAAQDHTELDLTIRLDLASRLNSTFVPTNIQVDYRSFPPGSFVTKQTPDMRKTVACWYCVLQRNKVSTSVPLPQKSNR
jgi:hypothetical protein